MTSPEAHRSARANARAMRVHNMLKRGASRNQVAKALGTSLQYIHQMAKRGQRIEQDITTQNPAGELSERIRNALDQDGCDPSSPSNVKAHYKCLRDLQWVPNIGAKSIRELQAWLRKHGQEPIT